MTTIDSIGVNKTTTVTITTEIETTTQTTTATPQKTDSDGMTSGGIAGVTIGVIAGVSVIVAVLMFLLLRERQKRKKGSNEYNQKIHKLKIDQLPSPSDVESAEIRPPTRKPTEKPEIEPDFGSSIHYQNVPNIKYENMTQDDDASQPIYLEPETHDDKRIYTTGEGSEYYVVDSLKKGLTEPSLPSREDKIKTKVNNVNKDAPKTKKEKGKKDKSNLKQNVNTSQIKDGANILTKANDNNSDNEMESTPPLHSAKDYINLKGQKLTPPAVIAKSPHLIEDDVYENEELPSTNTKR